MCQVISLQPPVFYTHLQTSFRESTMKKSIGNKMLTFPTPVFIVGTYDKKNLPNVMAVAWGGICCSQPLCLAISLRKATYTYENLKSRKAFTVNIPSEKYVREADYFGIASGREVNKFTRTGLTPAKSDLVDAPYVEEFPLNIECILLHTIEIGLHTQFIGEIEDVKVSESVMKGDLPDIEKVRPFTFIPDRREYYDLGSCLGKAFSIGKEIDL